MFDEEDDDGDTSSRYPSIPSLVALQMMKNRLQLAHLGKKLMKWSSMATGKELRRRALEMNCEFKDYGERVTNAYLLLARARFYNPEINKNVLQNVGRSAACVVDFENRTLIGVRFFEMIVTERNHDPNLHLGLEKGGEAIAAAKRAWRDLLKKMILLLECETAFQRIYVANKSSTKKQNVLGKVIIPKITNAIAYIKSELEEKEREETFRLKRFKYSKTKKLEREEIAKKKRKNLQNPQTIVEELEIIEIPETIAETKTIEEPEIIEKLENIEEIDILAELDIFEGPEINEEQEKSEELEKNEPKVMMLQIKTSKQKVIEPETIVLETVEPEVTEAVSEITFSYTAMSEINIAEVVPEVKQQEPYIILPEFIIQGEPSPLEKQKTFIPEIIFEGKTTNVVKNWDQFVNTSPYKVMSETTSTKQAMESAVSCPLCKAQTDVTNQRVLHLIDHVNQFLMLCKQNKIDFTKLETKGDKFNYKNIKKELELLSLSYSCPHKSSEERNKGDVGKRSCLMQRPDLCDDFKRRRGKEHESIYKCLPQQSSAMSYACKKTQIDNMTNNGSVISFFPTNCKFSFHSQCLANANYCEYCNWTPELTLYPSTSARREKDNNGTQTSHHFCKCVSGERSLSIKENPSPKPSNNSPYFKKSPTYYTSVPQIHYTSLNSNLMPYLSKKTTSNFKYFTNLLQYTLPMALYAPESRSGSHKISDMIYTSDWTNVIVPKEFATISTYQPSNLFSPFIEGLFDSCEISDTFNSVDSSNTVIRNDSLTCMTVLPQGYPGVVPYMSRFGFADVINNNPANVPVLKEYAKDNDHKFCKSLLPYAPEGRPGPSGISDDVFPVFFIANDSTSCSTDDTASISSISDTEINEDCVTGVLFQNHENLEIEAQNEKTDAQNLSQENAETTNELDDKLKNKNYHVYVMLTPNQNWPFNSYMREQTQKKNYQIDTEYQEQATSSKITRCGTCKFKDFSVYVTLTPSQNLHFKPSRREVRSGLSTSNKFDATNTTGTATYTDNATYVTTIRRKNKSGSYKTCSESTDPIQYRSGLGGVFDVRNITASETVTYTAPFTREGKPGSSDFSRANNEQFGRGTYTRPFEINITNLRPITSSTPFTREGKPGPFSIYDASNINTTNHIESVPYTREGRPGPFDISEKKSSSERRSASYEISELKNIRTSVPCTHQSRLPNDISEMRNSLMTTTFSKPKNREYEPGRCGVYSVVCVYTSEGTPRHCGLIEVCKNTCSNPCTSSNGRKCGTSEKINIANDNSVTPSMPYTREGRQRLNDIYSNEPMKIASSKPNTQECGPGRCGVYSIVCVYTGEGEPRHCGLIEICKSPCSKPLVSSTYRPQEKSGPCGTSEINNITASQTVTCFLPYTREGKHGSSITEANNIITTKQIGSVPYTREGRPGPFDISETSNNIASKQITPYTREGKPGPFGFSEKNNIIATKQMAPVPYTREGRPGPFDISEMSNNIASKQITPYTREGKPGPFSISEKNNIIATKQIAPVPYTREGRPGPFNISEMSNNIASKQITPYTREGKPGPFGIYGINNIIPTKQIAPVPYTREGKPGPFRIYEMSNNIASKQVTPYTREEKPRLFNISEVNNITHITHIETVPYTREGRPGPFDISEKNNTITSKQIAPVPYTREGKPGPFDIYEMNNDAASKHVTPYTREGRPGPFDISEVNDTTTNKQIAPVPYTCKEKPGPFDISEINNIFTSKLTKSSIPYTREGTPGPCGISEANNTTTTKQIDNNIAASKLNKSLAPNTRERIHRPYISEPSNMNNSFLLYSKPCEVYSIMCGNTSESKPGACCDMKTDVSIRPYTREGKPGPFSISETEIITTSKQCEPEPFTREARPGPFNIPEIDCCRSSQTKPCIREGIHGPCGILDESNMACPKHLTSCKSCKRKEQHGPYGTYEAGNITASNQFESMPYTREGRPGPFDIFKTIGDGFKTSDVATPRVYTRESRPVPFGLSEINNVTPNKEIADTTYYNVFMATTNPCQCGFNAPSTQKETPSSATSKSDQSCIETEYKKHVKNFRYKECDGTIVDEKRITIIKIKKRKPQKQDALEANKSTCISQNLENGTDLECKCCKQSKSENIRSSPDVMPCPKMRTSISTQVLKAENCTDKKSENQASSPNCDCGGKEPPKSPPIPCPNKHEDKECDCGAGASAKPSSCACSKKPEESASGPNCDCGGGASAKPSSCACSKKPEESGEKASAKPSSCACSKKPENSASGSKCNCGKEASAKPSSCACSKKSEDSTSDPKCSCGEEASIKPSSCACSKNPEDSASGPKCKCGDEAPPKPPPVACSNMLKDSASSQKCDCGGAASSEPPPIPCPNKPKDSTSGPKCNCGEKASVKPSSCACSKKPEDSASSTKCKCGDKAPPKPPPLVCANRLEDSASGPKCDCGEKASKPPSLVCANRLEDSASGPKCDCGDKAPKSPPLVCANRLKDSASGPKCDCGEKTSKPPSLVCANRLEDSASGPKCDCGGGAPPKPPLKSILVCANRLEDSASGPKCDCGDKAQKPPPLVCANRLEDSASGPKCDCGKKTSKPPSLVCANRLEDSASGPKCDCGEGTPPEPPPIPCPNKPKDAASGPKCNCGAPPIPCPNKPKVSASGPKCDCGGGAPPKSPPIPCPNKPKDVNSGPKCDCGGGTPPPMPCPNKPKDSASSTKCNCGEKVSAKPSSCACSKKPEDSAPNYDCGGGGKPPPIPCPNKPKDTPRSPKCDCGGGAPSKKPSISCPNKLKDSASSTKCNCDEKASAKPSSCSCSKKPEDSGPKCDCGGGGKPPPIPCPNKPKDSASGPKCDCGRRASSKPSSCSCSKKPEDSSPKCDCGGGGKPPPIPCPNKPKDTASSPKCDCGGGAPSKKPSSISCPNKLKDSASSTKCNCGEKASAKPSFCSCSKKPEDSAPKCDCGGGGKPPPIPCPNKPKESASGPKCDCGGGASSKPSSCSCSKKPEDSGPKCDCGGEAPSKKPSSSSCPNKLKDSTSSQKCNCGGGAPSKLPPNPCPNKLKDSASGPKCNCGGGAPSKPSSCSCSKKPEDSGPKCECGGGAPSKKSSSIECPNKLKDSASGPKCECGGGGNKPKNSNSSCGQVSGNRVVDLSANKVKDSASDAICHCVKEPPLSFDPVCPNLSRGSKTGKVSKKNSKTHNAPKCDCCKSDCAKEAPPKSACEGGAPTNSTGCGNKVEETCQTSVPGYPLCACTGEALSKALLQKVLDTLRCQKSPVICAPPDKPDRHANCFTDSSPSGSNKKKTCTLCGSPLANKETRPTTTKATCVCSDSSVHTRSKSKPNKNTTCGFCTFGRLTQNSNGHSNNTCEIDNKNYRSCNSAKEQNDAVTKFYTSTNKKKNDNDNFCTIKIITKSSKSRCCGTEYKSSLAFTATNTLEALRQLYRSPDHKNNKNICQTCYSPLTPSVGSEIREKPYVLCEFCQDKLVQENERGYRCTTYGAESTSCRSPTEGSPSRSMYSQKTNSNSRGCGNCRQL